jgi:hypothetical protein
VIEPLHEAPSSVPSTAKIKNKKEKAEQRRSFHIQTGEKHKERNKASLHEIRSTFEIH